MEIQKELNHPFQWKRNLLIPILVFMVLVLIDQIIKIYVKTHFFIDEEKNLLGSWFRIHFIENPGFAFGLEPSDILNAKDPSKAEKYRVWGKYLLTWFRILVTIFGFWYLVKSAKKKATIAFLICIALILAGALGNIIDSVFYGVVFKAKNEYIGGWFQGHVVDMFYAPMYTGILPKWFPFWGGEHFTFFSPIFNFADACITVGVALILIFQRRFLNYEKQTEIKENMADPISSSSDLTEGEQA